VASKDITPASVWIPISSRKSINALPQDFKQFCNKAWKIVMIKESQKQHAGMSPRTSNQMGGRAPKPLGPPPLHPTLISALYHFETSTSTLILHAHA
jgi:hypothetical protein